MFFLPIAFEYEARLKSSYDDIISAIDDFFDQWDQSTATPIEKVSGQQEGPC